jgi:hypothetical protein
VNRVIHQIDQRSPEWFRLRSGKLTGSCAKDMLASIKSGEAAARRDLRYRLMAERLSGVPQEDGYQNDVMRWGTEHESAAIAAYEVATGAMVVPVGFCELDGLMAGTSPDGLVADDGLVSVKCPKTATHCRYLRDGGEPSEHAAQNLHELWITGRAWIDFVSFDPRLPESMQLYVYRVTRNDAAIADYERKALAFLEEVAVAVESLRTSYNLRAQLEKAAS